MPKVNTRTNRDGSVTPFVRCRLAGVQTSLTFPTVDEAEHFAGDVDQRGSQWGWDNYQNEEALAAEMSLQPLGHPPLRQPDVRRARHPQRLEARLAHEVEAPPWPHEALPDHPRGHRPSTQGADRVRQDHRQRRAPSRRCSRPPSSTATSTAPPRPASSSHVAATTRRPSTATSRPRSGRSSPTPASGTSRLCGCWPAPGCAGGRPRPSPWATLTSSLGPWRSRRLGSTTPRRAGTSARPRPGSHVERSRCPTRSSRLCAR